MCAKLEYLSWDSDHFRYKIGRICLSNPDADLSRTLAQAKDAGYQLIYLMSPVTLSESTLGASIQPIDEKIIFHKEISTTQDTFEHISRYSKQSTDSSLRELAHISGQQSRFLLEERFSEEQFYSMYDTWIEGCVKGELADDIFIYEVNGNMAGFVAFSAISPDTGDIKLIAVHPQYQKLSIGSQLIQYVENVCSELNLRYLQVTTQGHNIAGCSLYKKNNFKIQTQTYIYHLWL